MLPTPAELQCVDQPPPTEIATGAVAAAVALALICLAAARQSYRVFLGQLAAFASTCLFFFSVPFGFCFFFLLSQLKTFELIGYTELRAAEVH